MKVTIIPEDKVVIVDGERREFDFDVDANYHAVQWNGEYGTIETKKGDNKRIADLSEFQEILDLHAAILAKEAAEEADARKPTTAHLSTLTNQHINGGITVDGIFIATGTEDRALINGAVTRALLDDNDTKTYPYYPTGGGKVGLTNAQFKTIGQAVANHAQKCLDVAESLDVNDYDTVEELETAYAAAFNS